MGAVLTEAELAEARLEKADLRGANLAQANLSGARLEGADLCGADLRLARGLKQAQIDQAVGDHRTALPTDLTRPAAWLPGGEQGLSQPGSQGHRSNGNESADPYEMLGVGPETSIQDIRVAWLKLVNDLKRDDAGEAPASERLRAINHAYQALKEREGPAVEQQRGRSPRYVLVAILLVAAIAVGALIAAVETYLARRGDPGGAAARANVKDGAPRSPLTAQQAPSG
jgi:DnaJ-domain-containing protein 1